MQIYAPQRDPTDLDIALKHNFYRLWHSTTNSLDEKRLTERNEIAKHLNEGWSHRNFHFNFIFQQNSYFKLAFHNWRETHFKLYAKLHNRLNVFLCKELNEKKNIKKPKTINEVNKKSKNHLHQLTMIRKLYVIALLPPPTGLKWMFACQEMCTTNV